MKRLPLTIATSDYDHMRDFRDGVVTAEGLDPTWLTMEIHEIFTRFTFNREWEVSELSFAKFIAQATREESDITAIPVWTSRQFRFSSFYCNVNSGISEAADFAGKRIAVPEWAQTAAVYTRGWLEHNAGVDLKSVHWVQAGTEQPGRGEKVELNLPEGLEVERIEDKSISEMLASGEIDGALVARAPKVFEAGHPDVRRVFPNYREVEERYFDETGIFPIMHVIALRKDILADNPWIARNLYNAFLEAKQRAMARFLEISVSRYCLPWAVDHAEQMMQKFNGDIFPYGIDANRKTLEAFCQYAFEQGIAHYHAKPEDLFAKGSDVDVQI
ncbi:MAG: ABC transporter substrate-binding protein [Alphaproteobacteria bacterium]|nr:ABC transporter substrate-binding protein [Alphaproteobacteria bacterium]